MLSKSTFRKLLVAIYLKLAKSNVSQLENGKLFHV